MTRRVLNASPARLASIVWASACDTRRELDSLIVKVWPTEGLTRDELRRLRRALGLIDEARREIMSLQSSLSKRSKDGGYERPDFTTARKLRL